MAEAIKKTHPIRGALWGLMLGVGLAFVLVFTTVIYLDLVTILIIVGVCIVVGILWGLFAPAKAPKGPEPIPVEQTAAPESSRFDDFTDTEPDDAPTGTAATEPNDHVAAPDVRDSPAGHTDDGQLAPPTIETGDGSSSAQPEP